MPRARHACLLPASLLAASFWGSASPAANAQAAPPPADAQAAPAAYPTTAPFWGPSGLGVIPTTDTVAATHVQVGLGYEHVNPESGGTVNFFPVASATYGFRRGEVGAGYLQEKVHEGDFSLTDNNYALYAKYRAFEDARSGAALAVGVHYFRPGGSGHTLALYLTGSVPLARRADGSSLARGHLGLLVQDVHLADTGSFQQARPMAGLEFFPARGVTLAGDYVPVIGNEPRLWSLVARYQSVTGVGCQIGYGQQQDQDKKVFASLAYTFGQAR